MPILPTRSTSLLESHVARPVLALALVFGVHVTTVTAQQGASAARPRFVDGQAQVVPAFEDPSDWIQHDLWVETEFDSDGNGKLDRMHVDVTRPGQTDSDGLKVAIIYETSPYFAGTARGRSYFWSPHQELGTPPPPRAKAPSVPVHARRPIQSRSQIERWLPLGFAVVHSSSPGTGLSQGCPTVGGDNESLAPKAVIDWLCGRAHGYTTPDGDESVVAYWSLGKVGMTGTSYNGTLPLAAATTGVGGLEAIIPISPNTSYYRYYRANGLVRHPGGWMGEDIDVLYDFINSGRIEGREHCDCTVRDGEMRGNFDRTHGDYNDFWAKRDYLNDLAPMHAAALFAHGLNDWNVMPSHSIRIYCALRKRGLEARLYLHQGGHGGEPPFAMMNRWFSHYLYGVDNGIEREPHAWIVREGAVRGQASAYAEYPNPGATPAVLFPRAHDESRGDRTVSSDCGRLQTSKRGEGRLTIVDDAQIRGRDLAQVKASPHRLLFTTPILSRPVQISGTPRIRIRLSVDRPAANLSVWLLSLPWTRGRGSTNIITRGWADPQNYRSLRESEPLEPDRFYDVAFDLESDDQVIPAGQQIGLMIFSSDHDFTLWPKAGTRITVDLSATQLELPMVGGRRELDRATEARRARL